jgi:hypothetical protein
MSSLIAKLPKSYFKVHLVFGIKNKIEMPESNRWLRQ